MNDQNQSYDQSSSSEPVDQNDAMTPLQKYEGSITVGDLIEKNDNSTPNAIFASITDEFSDATRHFIELSEIDAYDPGDQSNSEKYVNGLFKAEGSEKVFLWLNNIFTANYFKNKHLVLGILQILSHAAEAKNNASAQTISSSALLGPDTEIIEYAIRCFENWEDQRFIPVLEKVNCEEPWLREYRDGVIEDLKMEE